MDLQKLVDALGDSNRRTQSDYHLTLGAAIDQLENVPETLAIKFDWNGSSPKSPDSYRGYYSDLAFESRSEPTTVGSFIADCRRSVGATFEGYKGGDFVMMRDTPLWASEWGHSSGRAIIALAIGDDTVILVTKELE